MIEKLNRRHPGLVYKIAFLFAFVAVFTFLSLKLPQDSQAASLANFKPGNIISDYTMGNYTTMTVADIDNFLHAHGNCNDTNTAKASWYPSLHYHIKDGHFVCLADELFATSGVGYGDFLKEDEESQTAAEIIYEVSQKYKINPQVLIVLLEKEQGLISDSWPNSIQYRSATGFGCPDTAPCDSKYYGLKNQLESAAWLFRNVLDGGWTNYPLGSNYIYYNPNSACGGSIVNIENLATSALHRYTPYQPSAAALAAGYGTVTCGAYGNRNFYLFFMDWFGDPTISKATIGEFENMAVPRVLYIKSGARYIDTQDLMIREQKQNGLEFFTQRNYQDNKLCLSTDKGKNCYLYSDLEELETSAVEQMTVDRMLTINNNAKLVDFVGGAVSNYDRKDDMVHFTHKTQLNGQLCLIAAGLSENSCILYTQLSELPSHVFSKMVVPRKLYIKPGATIINANTGVSRKNKTGTKEHFDSLTYWLGNLCLQSETMREKNECALYTDLVELQSAKFEAMAVPRFLKVNEGASFYDAETGQKSQTTLKASGVLFFSGKTTTRDGLCLKPDSSTSQQQPDCILYTDLSETLNFTPMTIPRHLSINANAHLFDIESGAHETKALTKTEELFVDKITLSDGALCLRSQSDKTNNLYKCVKYTDLTEKP